MDGHLHGGRASYREDFRDAKQFGWEVPDQHLFDWTDLLKKKVLPPMARVPS